MTAATALTAANDVTDRGPDSPENPHAGFGAVVLDIGGDVGALVVTMPDSWVGEEVEIECLDGPALAHHGHGHGHGHDGGHGPDDHGHRPHVAVVRRPVADGELVPSLVFTALTAGRYGLYPKGGADAVLEVTVDGGAVTEAEWPA